MYIINKINWFLIQYRDGCKGDCSTVEAGWVACRERVKIAPGTGTASSGVPVWA